MQTQQEREPAVTPPLEPVKAVFAEPRPSLGRTLRLIAGRQKRNFLNLLKARPVAPPSLGSMTLDRYDVELAKRLLEREDLWMDGPAVGEYEKEFARWNGSAHAYAFMGGRVALSAAIYALGLGPGDEVILPGYTCVVVPNAFKYENVRIVYADIELDTYGLDVDSVKKVIGPRTKAIVIQHLFGLVCRDYDRLLDLAKSRRIKVIEDCAHATGAEYRGRKIGNLGDVAFYSSEQSKIFTTIQGGIATTNSIEISLALNDFKASAAFPEAEKIRALLCSVVLNYYQQKHPSRWILGDVAELRYGKYRLISTGAAEMQGMKPAGYGARMPAALAALGLNQLRKIDGYNELRRKNALRWDRWCERKGLKKPLVIEGSKPVFLRYPVMVQPEKKKDLSWALDELKMQPGLWFRTNLHPAPGVLPECPNANKAVEGCINLPSLWN